MKRCPFCAEEILDTVVVCRHCGRDLPEEKFGQPSLRRPPALPDSTANQRKPGLAAYVVATLFLGLTALVVVDLVDRPPRLSNREAEASNQVARPAHTPEAEAAPPQTYKIAETRDVSIGPVCRLDIRVSLPEHYPRETVQRIAEIVVKDTTKGRPVNAIGLLFYGPGISTAGTYDVARIDWAPNGRWSDADTVQAGDYSTFRYAVTYKEPVEKPVAKHALRSGRRSGLLGVPLPEGARLLRETSGDPATGRDPTQRYSVSATSGEIAEFFNQAMETAGWEKDGTSLCWSSVKESVSRIC